MSPHEHDTRRRTTGSETLSATWDRYLASRGPRLHGDLLKAVDGHIRSETRRLLGRGHPMSEEVAQEALVGAARRIATDERPEFPVAYVRKIVHNKVVDLLRQEAKRREREQQQWSPDIDPAEASMSAEWHDFLETLRKIVSDDEFWTLVLRYHFDYSYGEIGDLLDKEPNAVRQIAHRGRHKCREHLTRLEGRVPAWVMLPDGAPDAPPEVSDGAPDGSSDVADGGGSTPGDGAKADTSGPGAGTGSEVGGQPTSAGSGGEPTTVHDARAGTPEVPSGDQPGQREPRRTDPADRSRRPSAGSDSETANRPPAAVFPTVPVARALWRRRPRLRPDGPGRPFGSPMTVVPLTLMVALPLLFQVNRALDATVVVGTSVRTAQLVEDHDGIGPTRPPSGPTISVIPSTAPTDQREAPSTSAPPTTSSDPPTDESSTPTAAATTSTEPSTTTESVPPTTPTTSTTLPPTTRQTVVTTPRTAPPPTTTRGSTAPPPTSGPSTQPSTTTSRATTSSNPTTPTSPTTTTTTTAASTTTTATTTATTESTTTTSSTTSTTAGRTTTSGRGPGDGNEPPPNQ